MTTRRQTANDDTLFWTLKVLQDNPGATQRTIAKEVGINVSTINFCLKALVEKGWIKIGNFSRNPDKLCYAYGLKICIIRFYSKMSSDSPLLILPETSCDFGCTFGWVCASFTENLLSKVI